MQLNTNPLHPRAEFLAGVRDQLPILLGTMPFGMIFGVLALQAGLPKLQAQAMSAVIFAGSAQFVTAQLLRDGAGAVVIVLTVFVVNLRHALYSATLSPHLQHLPGRWKGVLAYLLTDEAFAVAITRYIKPGPPPVPDNRHWYFLGSGFTLWSSWQLSTAVGVFFGAQVPASWQLDFTLALTFIALVIPNLKDRGGMAAALVGGVVAVAANGAPFRLGLIIAAVCGIGAGVVMDRLGSKQASP